MILCVHLILLPFLQFKNHKSCFWIKEGLSFLCRHALTKVESQRVIQISAGFMIFFSIFGTIDQNILYYLINSALWHWYFTSFSNILYMIELENSCWWTIALSLSLNYIQNWLSYDSHSLLFSLTNYSYGTFINNSSFI